MANLMEGFRHLIIIAFALTLLQHFNIIFAPLSTCGCVNDTQWYHLQVLVLAHIIGLWKDLNLWFLVRSEERDCASLWFHRQLALQIFIFEFALIMYQVTAKVLQARYSIAYVLVQTVTLEWLSVSNLSTDEGKERIALV
jgi:hypothetical protein